MIIITVKVVQNLSIKNILLESQKHLVG